MMDIVFQQFYFIKMLQFLRLWFYNERTTSSFDKKYRLVY